MATRYPRDDDWGDWMHEQRKQKALDKRLDDEQLLAAVPPALRAQVASDLANVRAQSRAFDMVLEAFRHRTTYEQDVTCPLCGSRSIRHTRDPKAPGAVMGVCDKCTGG